MSKLVSSLELDTPRLLAQLPKPVSILLVRAEWQHAIIMGDPVVKERAVLTGDGGIESSNYLPSKSDVALDPWLRKREGAKKLT